MRIKMGKFISRISLVILIFCLIAGIVYISLLGENDRATTTVKTYFDNIATQRYEENTKLCTKKFNRQFNNLNDPITYQFSLETALLNHFGLINTASYITKTRREEFWVPFFDQDMLHVSIEVHAKGSSNILKNLFSRKDKPYLKNFVTLVKKDGRWEINKIDIQAAAIAEDFQKTKLSMQNSRYIRQTATGLLIKENKIDFSLLDPIQKRILIFNLNKALTLLKTQKTPTK